MTFSDITEDSLYIVKGTLSGQIAVDVTEEYSLEIEMQGLTVKSDTASPVTVTSADKFTLTAKKDTENFIYDNREAVSGDVEGEYKAAIFADCDMTVGGKGSLTVVSESNNGIRSKKDLTVKNLTLSVTSSDNPLKGNDSVTVSSATLTLISVSGDGMDANSTTSYKGIVFSGGDCVIICTSGGNSAIDTERGYTYSGGRVLAVMPQGGMTSEATNCSGFTSLATQKSLSLSSGGYITASVSGEVQTALRLPCSMSATVIYLGSPSATLQTSSSVSYTLDSDGVYFAG